MSRAGPGAGCTRSPFTTLWANEIDLSRLHAREEVSPDTWEEHLAEDFNGYQDSDGCPEGGPPKVEAPTCARSQTCPARTSIVTVSKVPQ